MPSRIEPDTVTVSSQGDRVIVRIARPTAPFMACNHLFSAVLGAYVAAQIRPMKCTIESQLSGDLVLEALGAEGEYPTTDMAPVLMLVEGVIASALRGRGYRVLGAQA